MRILAQAVLGTSGWARQSLGRAAFLVHCRSPAGRRQHNAAWMQRSGRAFARLQVDVRRRPARARSVDSDSVPERSWRSSAPSATGLPPATSMRRTALPWRSAMRFLSGGAHVGGLGATRGECLRLRTKPSRRICGRWSRRCGPDSCISLSRTRCVAGDARRARESADSRGRAPATIRTRDLAEEVVAIYWPHTPPYRQDAPFAQTRRGTST